jgi:DNA repair protein RecO
METNEHGVLIQAIPYLESNRILKIFTQTSGLITLVEKKAAFKIFNPFCIAEWVYRKSRKEIHTLIDGDLIDDLIDLRKSYPVLKAAGSIAKDLLSSQLPGRHSPALYHLLCSYFKKLPLFENPAILPLSFRLKLLIHEGLLSLDPRCSLCKLEASILMQGESVCPEHASYPFIAFSNAEWRAMHGLAFCRQFSLLQQIDSLSTLEEKLAALFLERMHH